MEDEELDDETRRQFVATVREQVERLGKLATDLLDLSRLEAGSLELRREQTDLGALDARGQRGVRARRSTSTTRRSSCASARADRHRLRS